MTRHGGEEVTKPNPHERIAKLGPVEVWGRRRQTPNEFTAFADSARNLLDEIARALWVDRLMDWMARKLERRTRGRR